MRRPELHPEILTRDGKKAFAVLPYEEFVAFQEWLEDLEDLVDLRAAKDSEHGAPAVPLGEIERQFDDVN
jgi:hypothetical protein